MSEPLNLAHLRAVAKAATQGKWQHFSLNGVNAVEAGKKPPIVKWSGFDDSFRSPAAHKANAAYIAAFDPPTVLALISETENFAATILNLAQQRDAWKARAEAAEYLAEQARREERARLASKISCLVHHCFWLPDYGFTTPDQDAGQRVATGMIRRVQNAILEEDRRQGWKDKQDALRDAGEPYFDWRAEEGKTDV